MRPFDPLRRVHLAAVEDTAAQLTFWAVPGELTVRVGEQHHTIAHPGGPGAVEVTDLTPDTAYRAVLRLEGVRRVVALRTLASPPGQLLTRIATVSDLHLGSSTHGIARTMFDRSPWPEPAPLRCARGAVTAAAAWGAEALVGKGDLTHHGWAEEWEQLAGLLTDHATTMRCIGVPGNHDLPSVRELSAASGLERAGLGGEDVTVVDLDGARVIAFDSCGADAPWGDVHRNGTEVLDAVAEAAATGRAALVFLHHPLERTPARGRYPKGVPWAEGRRFAARLAQANPRTLLSAGHTHRNRRRDVGPVVHTEVGSTKDWPGVWAGYAVHEGGIRQVVRRITAPDAIGWIDYSRWAAGGLWWPYSPGRLADRCFTHRWGGPDGGGLSG